jgi:hypothetical protein
MGEVLEHVEQPLAFLKKAQSLLSSDGVYYVTVPMNMAAIDHIYLFRELDDIFKLIKQAGLEVIDYTETPVQAKYSVEKCHKNRLPTMAAIFMKKLTKI